MLTKLITICRLYKLIFIWYILFDTVTKFKVDCFNISMCWKLRHQFSETQLVLSNQRIQFTGTFLFKCVLFAMCCWFRLAMFGDHSNTCVRNACNIPWPLYDLCAHALSSCHSVMPHVIFSLFIRCSSYSRTAFLACVFRCNYVSYDIVMPAPEHCQFIYISRAWD
jgi:hypothetical protein